jgi:hypothetical protein
VRRFEIPEGTKAGAYRVIACSDARQVVAERSEANNCRVAASRVMIPTVTPPIVPPPA